MNNNSPIECRLADTYGEKMMQIYDIIIKLKNSPDGAKYLEEYNSDYNFYNRLYKKNNDICQLLRGNK